MISLRGEEWGGRGKFLFRLAKLNWKRKERVREPSGGPGIDRQRSGNEKGGDQIKRLLIRRLHTQYPPNQMSAEREKIGKVSHTAHALSLIHI